MNSLCRISMDHVDGRVAGMIVPEDLGCLDFAMEQYLDGCHRIVLTVDNLDWQWNHEFSETAMEDRRERDQE